MLKEEVSSKFVISAGYYSIEAYYSMIARYDHYDSYELRSDLLCRELYVVLSFSCKGSTMNSFGELFILVFVDLSVQT
jgi:hypothetical protein